MIRFSKLTGDKKMPDLTSRLSKCYASAIHDVLREKGYGNCVLPPEIQALERGQ